MRKRSGSHGKRKNAGGQRQLSSRKSKKRGRDRKKRRKGRKWSWIPWITRRDPKRYSKRSRKRQKSRGSQKYLERRRLISRKRIGGRSKRSFNNKLRRSSQNSKKKLISVNQTQTNGTKSVVSSCLKNSMNVPRQLVRSVILQRKRLSQRDRLLRILFNSRGKISRRGRRRWMRRGDSLKLAGKERGRNLLREPSRNHQIFRR